MKEGWKRVTLGEIATKMADGPFGSNLKATHYTEKKEVRIIQLSNIGEEGWREDNTKYTTFSHLETISRSEVFPNDIVIAKMMPAGRAIICPNKEKKYVLSSDAVKVCLKEGYDSRFVCFQINSSPFRKQVYENVSGSGRVRTSLTKLRDCFICIPPLPEQQRIVEYLDSTFAEIDALKAKAAEEVANAKAMFDAALREEMTPKEGWEEFSLSQVCEIQSGYAFKSSCFKTEGQFQIIRMGNVRPGILRLIENPVFGDFEDEKIISKAKLNRGDIIITQTGTRHKRDYGFTAIIDSDNLMLNQRLARLRVISSVSNSFVLYYTWTDLFRDQFFANEGGAVGQGNVGIDAIKNSIIPLPPYLEQQRIVTRLDSLRSLLTELEQKYAKIAAECDALKQAILRETFE